ncbi:CGP-CTERM sorting domain-containing protein [Thermococcus sp.]
MASTESFGNGFSDVLLLKLDQNGELEWAKTYGRMMEDEANSMTFTGKGIVIVAYTQSFKVDTWGNAWVFEVDKDGNFLWGKTLGGSKFDTAQAVATLPNGIIVGGSTRSFGNGKDAWLIAFDNSGNVLWQVKVGNASSDDWVSSLLPINGDIFAGGNRLAGVTTDGKLLWVKRLFVWSFSKAGKMVAFAGRTLSASSLSGSINVVGIFDPEKVETYSGCSCWESLSFSEATTNATVKDAPVEPEEQSPKVKVINLSERDVNLELKPIWGTFRTSTSSPEKPSQTSSSPAPSKPSMTSSPVTTSSETPSPSGSAQTSTQGGRGGICGPALLVALALLPLLGRGKL